RLLQGQIRKGLPISLVPSKERLVRRGGPNPFGEVGLEPALPLAVSPGRGLVLRVIEPPASLVRGLDPRPPAGGGGVHVVLDLVDEVPANRVAGLLDAALAVDPALALPHVP